MKIALIAPLAESVPPKFYGGTERVVDYLARGLVAAGVEVTLFASGDSHVPGCEVVAPLAEAFRLSKRPIADPGAYAVRMMAQVADHAHRFDVIHNHADYGMLPISRMTRTRLLTTLHGRLDLPDIPAAFLSYPDARFVSISDHQRGPLALLPWVRTIHHGLPVGEFPFYPQPGKYLAFLGRIDRDKRPEWAIEIAHRAGIPLKIAAKVADGEGREYFERLVRPHVDGKNVEFLGEISDREKTEFLGNALGLVFPIDWPEPFGLVMIEALACGTPVLARPCGAVPEVLESGVTGFTSPDLETLARGALELGRIDRAGCRAYFERRFSLSRMTEEYIDVYRELQGGQAGIRPAGDRRHLLHPV